MGKSDMRITLSINKNSSEYKTDEEIAKSFESQILKALQLRQKELDPKKFMSTSKVKKK